MTSRLRCAGLALAVSSCALAACGDNNTGGGGDDDPPDIDAATTQDPDARLIDAGDDIDGAVSTGLLVHYPFEDTGTSVSDLSGRAMHGTLTDVAAWTADGRTERGL